MLGQGMRDTDLVVDDGVAISIWSSRDEGKRKVDAWFAAKRSSHVRGLPS